MTLSVNLWRASSKLSNHTAQHQRDQDYALSNFALLEEWLDKTMDDLEKLVNEIFHDKRYVLNHLKIKRGSIIVTFKAPLSEADSLITLLLRTVFVGSHGWCQSTSSC